MIKHIINSIKFQCATLIAICTMICLTYPTFALAKKPRQNRNLKSTAILPTVNDVLNVHASSAVRYFGGRTTDMTGESVTLSPFGGDLLHYWRAIDELRCRTNAKKPGFVTCTYLLSRVILADPDSALGSLQVAALKMTGSDHSKDASTNDFVLRKGTWTSTTIDTYNAKAVADNKLRQQQSSRSTQNCGMQRDYSDLSSAQVRYSFQCN